MATLAPELGLSPVQAGLKRAFDITGALLGLILTCWIIVPAWVAASIDTRTTGFFTQARVGRYGRVFHVVKLRTMRPSLHVNTTVTTGHDPRITRFGRFFRKTKLDELPQLWNVLLGHMSFVGPRPDVPGYADRLQGEDRVLLSVRPGITGPAAVYYRDEEALLAAQADPQRFNDEVLWPDKVRLNREYVEHYSFMEDLRLILDTVLPFLRLSRASCLRATGIEVRDEKE